jgi:hypothetical protein
MNFF